jgi:glucose-6-phosphate 1-dehydrogenase
MSKTSDTQQINPLREGLANRAVPQACTVVIFGATGDLTMRKLIPALYNIAADGELPPAVTVVGFARRRMPAVALRRSVLCSRCRSRPLLRQLDLARRERA